MPNWTRDVAGTGCLAVIVAGVYLLVGTGWACISGGLLGLAALTVDAWLPLVLSRHGKATWD